MGIYCNLHISVEEIYKFVFLHVEYLFVFPCNLSCIFSFAVIWFGLFFLNVHAAKKDLFFICLKRKETQNVLFAILLYLISIQLVWNTLPLPILPFDLVF